MILGPRIQPPKPAAAPEWRPVPGKPHLYVDAQGRMKYAPPPPPILGVPFIVPPGKKP